jgi:hypothetical protein
MIDKQQVLSVVRMKGLVVPSDLVREFHADTFIMGAVLSDLVHDKTVAVTTVKIGGSPVYYAIENKEKLVDLYKYLNEKDKATYMLLCDKRVLLDAAQSPLVRVSLRNMKDYAKPIEVTAAGETKLFWKWYLATEQEVQDGLRTLFSQQQTPIAAAPVQAIVSPTQPVKKQRKPATLKESSTVKPQQLQLSASSLVIPLDDPFAQQVAQFFEQKKSTLIRFSVVKKGEIDCVVDVPGAFGAVRYLCKAKNKKKYTEGELATVFVAGQLEKLPVLFLTTGELSQKLFDRIQLTYPNMKVIQLSEAKV